jgi:hypothetical protein
LDEFVARWLEGLQVGLVLSRALIGERVELEMDLIKPAREPDSEGRPVVAPLEA